RGRCARPSPPGVRGAEYALVDRLGSGCGSTLTGCAWGPETVHVSPPMALGGHGCALRTGRAPRAHHPLQGAFLPPRAAGLGSPRLTQPRITPPPLWTRAQRTGPEVCRPPTAPGPGPRSAGRPPQAAELSENSGRALTPWGQGGSVALRLWRRSRSADRQGPGAPVRRTTTTPQAPVTSTAVAQVAVRRPAGAGRPGSENNHHAASPAPPRPLRLGLVQQPRAPHQTQMRIRLRMIAQRPLTHRIELLRQQPRRPRAIHQMREQLLRLRTPTRRQIRLDQPRRAQMETPLTPRQPVITVIPVHRRPTAQLRLDRRHRRLEPL
ncbi:hypothetical protein SAMN05421803_1371, partial [Nocardiopsis flavescens]